MITIVELNEMSKKVYPHTVKKGDMIKTVWGYEEVQEVEVVTTKVEFNGKMYPSTTTTITTNGNIPVQTYKLAETVIIVRVADLVAKAEADAVLTDAEVDKLERASVLEAEERFKTVKEIKAVASAEQMADIDLLTNEEIIEQYKYLLETIEGVTTEVVAPVDTYKVNDRVRIIKGNMEGATGIIIEDRVDIIEKYKWLSDELVSEYLKSPYLVQFKGYFITQYFSANELELY